MVKRAALTTLLLAVAVLALAYASAFLSGGPPRWAVWAFALATPASLVAVMALGAARAGRLGPLGGAFALVFLLLAGGFALVLLLPPEDPTDPVLWLGLPRRAAVLIYGVGLVPLVLVPVAYALTFDSLTLDAEQLERVRRIAARGRGPAAGAGAAASVGRAPAPTGGEDAGPDGAAGD
ncbi:MAG: hypothetical protein ACODAE_06415, partial [Gemmatimonadota bacterium]